MSGAESMRPGEVRVTRALPGMLRPCLCCPGCGSIATIDDDQFRGRVSVDCSECEYHETVDWSKRVSGRGGVGDLT